MIDIVEDNGASLPRSAAAGRGRGVRLSSLLAGAVLGSAGAALALVILWITMARDATALLTESDYEAAIKRWQQRGPESYHLDVILTAGRPGRVHVEVRHGEVARMTRDGVVPKQKRTWDYWSVPGQFDTIGRELEMRQDPATSFGAPPGTQVVLRAAFDPELGYPRRFRRDVLGMRQEVQWEVVNFGTDK
jgi:hypothetical protein